MTSLQFKKALNAELRAAELGPEIQKITDETDTTLIFAGALSMRLLTWLNDRFMNGVSITEARPNEVTINAPNKKKVDITFVPGVAPLERNRFLTMAEILERLNEFKENTDCDVNSDSRTTEEINTCIRQSSQLAQAIGLLTNLGKNSNF